MSDDNGDLRYWIPREHRPLWPEERTEQLKALHAKGLSSSQMAQELGGGLTRNAVIGKVHRLGLHRAKPEPKPKPVVVPRHTLKAPIAIAAIKANPERSNYSIAFEYSISLSTVRQARRLIDNPEALVEQDGRKYTRRAAPRQADAPESIVGAIGLFDLQSTSCRFPVGEATGVEQLFCGALQTNNCSYCATHARKAYWCGPRLREAA